MDRAVCPFFGLFYWTDRAVFFRAASPSAKDSRGRTAGLAGCLFAFNGAPTVNRWLRLSAAVVAMMMIANLQYAWTLFVDPIRAATHWKLSDVQWGFTLFIAFETWAMPCSGWLIDRDRKSTRLNSSH